MKPRTAARSEELRSANFSLKKLSLMEFKVIMALYNSAHALGALEIQKRIAGEKEQFLKNKGPAPSYMRIRRILESFAKGGIVEIRNVAKEGHGHASIIYYLPDGILEVVKRERQPYEDASKQRDAALFRQLDSLGRRS